MNYLQQQCHFKNTTTNENFINSLHHLNKRLLRIPKIKLNWSL